EGIGGSDGLHDPCADCLSRLQRLLEGKRLNVWTCQDANEIDDPLVELLRVIPQIATVAMDCVIEVLSQEKGIGNPIGNLTLQRDLLVVGGQLIENERNIDAGNGHEHNRRGWLEVEEGEAASLSTDLAIDVLNYEEVWSDPEVVEPEHGGLLPLRCVAADSLRLSTLLVSHPH